MKSPIATLMAAGAGIVLGIAVAADLGIRDAVCTHLSLFDPGYIATQRNIATAYKQLGNGLMLVDADKARDAFAKSMVIDQSITMSVPNDAAAESGVAYAYGRLGSLAMSLDDYAEAAPSFERGLKVLDFLKQDTKPSDKLPLWISSNEALLTRDEKAAGPNLYEYWKSVQEQDLAICRDTQRAIEDLDFVLGQPRDRVPELLVIRGRGLAKQARHAEAVATAGRLAALTPMEGKHLFDAARIYALAAANMKPAEAGRLSPEDRAHRDSYCCRAVDLLTQAAKQHCFDEPVNRLSLAAERDLTPLRNRDDFKKLQTTIAGRQ